MAYVCLAVIKALLTRLLFAAHCLVTAWRVVHVYGDMRFWLLLVAIALMAIETLITLIKRKGREPKWFCPSFFIYLCGVVPGIWFLELDRLGRLREKLALDSPLSNVSQAAVLLQTTPAAPDLLTSALGLDDNVTTPLGLDVFLDNVTAALDVNVTLDLDSTSLGGDTLASTVMDHSEINVSSTESPVTLTDSMLTTGPLQTLAESLLRQGRSVDGDNSTLWDNQTDNSSSASGGDVDKVTKADLTGSVSSFPGVDWLQIDIPLQLDPDMWVNSIEQSMLLLLIIGRWFLPKGDITRDQLSQLLFVYIGMASDIMELYYLFLEPVVLQDTLISYVILGVWSLSLFQFTLVLTATRARKTHVAHPEAALRAHNERCCCACCDMCASEIWSILVMVLFQDAPFLTTRLYITITYRLFTYNIIFFTAKNALIIMLQFYRFLVVVCVIRKRERYEQQHDVENVAQAPTAHTRAPEPNQNIYHIGRENYNRKHGKVAKGKTKAK